MPGHSDNCKERGMNITKIEIQNFLTIGNAKVDLDGRGLLLIQGVNEDDTSAKSNGAGKSSVADAICWGIYGTTARDVTGDAVVNKTTKKDCVVSVEVVDGATTYEIKRHRKHKTGKNEVRISSCVGTLSPVIDISKGTDKETQEVINAVMGCSLEVFMAAVYAGQERMPDLPGLTDKMLKTLIEEAAGVEVLTEAYTEARNRFNAASSKLFATTNSHNLVRDGSVRLDADLHDYETQSKIFEDGRRERAKAELSKVLPMNAQVAKWEAEINPVYKHALESELDACKVKIDSHKAEQTKMDGFTAALALRDRDVTRLKTQYANGKAGIEALEKKLANIKGHIGEPCGECGKPYHEDDLATAALAQQEAIDKAKNSLRPIAVDLKAALEAVPVASDAATKFKASMTDVSSVAARQRDLSGMLTAIGLLERSIEGKRKEIESVKAVANSKLTETNAWSKAIESKAIELKRNQETIDRLAIEMAKETTEVEILTSAVKVFGPAGVRAHILDTVTPYLNDRTQEYLGALSDGNIHATWATLSKTAKGDLKEKFNIEVSNDHGAESFAGLSGGEKRKVRLATAMALQDMVAGRATKPINILMCDEIDDAVDEAGLERLMTVLEKKARERGTVLIISHNGLADWCDQIITVTKKDGLSTLSGATEHGF